MLKRSLLEENRPTKIRQRLAQAITRDNFRPYGTFWLQRIDRDQYAAQVAYDEDFTERRIYYKLQIYEGIWSEVRWFVDPVYSPGKEGYYKVGNGKANGKRKKKGEGNE